jgi:superfamily II DNA/RNA helicase
LGSLRRIRAGDIPREISAAAGEEAVHILSSRKQLGFPDRWFIEWDCGKLRILARLLSRLYTGGHKCILFTQMSKMLDILEYFVNLHGYTYVRLDGSTKVERRQLIVDQFNKSPKLFLFIASTRSGGVGINLTSADTVIFYDSDWNPAMDKQAMDRCHRIGQTREVNIYRLISESTIEENIFKKQLEKRQLDEIVVDGGAFTPDALQKRWSATDVLGLFSEGEGANSIFGSSVLWQQQPKTADVEGAMTAVEDREDVVALSAAMKEEKGKDQADSGDFVNKEEEAFNKLPSIIKYGVRLFENLLGADDDDSEYDEDDVEVKMGGWESDSESESDGPSKRPRLLNS